MQDRLAELRDGVEDEELQRRDLERGGEDDGDFMSDFFEEVAAIKSSMSVIRHNIDAIRENYGSYFTAVTGEQAKEVNEELERLTTETNREFQQVDKRLKAMKDANSKVQGSSENEFRIRINMHQALTKKYLDEMMQYQEIQTQYKNLHREKVERQMKIVYPEATEEQITQAIESGKAAEVFATIITDPGYTQEADDALNYVTNKHKEIQKLEQSIEELHQLFIDMAVLVEAQGELIDQIEANATISKAYTEEGVKQVVLAGRYQRKNRRQVCIMLCCLVIVLIVVIGPTLASVLSSDE